MRVSSIYIHIPFCRRKCNYCDFVSYPCGEYQPQLAAYGGWLQQELDLYRQQGLELDGLRTVYFGGGTPSLLEPETVARLLEQLPSAAEITLEANPETVDLSRLQQFYQAGVNRLSLGVQSFHDELLQAMGRRHSARQARQAVAWARQAGFANVGADLIYGLPGQTLAQWRAEVEQALALETEHISLYGLSLEPGTPWGERAARGELTAADEDLSADMLEFTIDRLTQAGFHHYEISNFARPGYESQHNCTYWRRRDYLGLGAAAAGCFGSLRYSNLTGLEEYAARLRQGRLPVAEQERLTTEELLAEAMFLGLRLTDGVEYADFLVRYGADLRTVFAAPLQRLTRLGLLEADQRGVRLSGRGLMLGNVVFREFV